MRAEKFSFFKKDILILGALLLTAILPFAHILLRDDVLIYSSDINLFFPLEVVNRQLLSETALPLWNPYFGAGSPQFGKIQAGLFYPTSLPLRLLPVVAMFNWDAVLHIFLAGAGVFVLLRHWRASRMAAAAAAVIFMFSGAVLPRIMIGHVSVVHTIAWTGWVLWAYARLLARGSWGNLLLTVVFTALILLGGQPQFSLIVLLIPAGYFLTIVLSKLPNWKRLIQPALLSTCVALLTAGLVAFQFLPYFEWVSQTIRGQGLFVTNLWIMIRESLAIEGIANILMPLLWYSPELQVTINFSTNTHFWESSPFVTVTALFVLSLSLGIPNQERRPLVRFLAGVALIGLLLSLGNYNPLYRWLLEYFPVFRSPGRFLLLWAFGLTLLTGFALDALSQAWASSGRRLRREQRSSLGVFFFSFLTWSGFQLWGDRLIANLIARGKFDDVAAEIALASIPRSLFLLMLTTLGLSLLLWLGQSGRLSRRHWRYGIVLLMVAESWAVARIIIRPYPVQNLYRDDHPLAQLTIDPAAVRVAGYREPPSYLTPTLRHNKNGDEYYLLDHLLAANEARGNQLLAAAFMPATSPAADAEYTVVQQTAGAYLHEHVGNLPRLYAAPAVTTIRQDEDALDFVLADTFVHEQQAVVTLAPGLEAPDLPAGPADPAQLVVTALDYQNNAIAAVITTDRPVLLIFNEMDYPGWQATIDGADAPIYRSNYAFRGLALEAAGTYEVALAYRPRQVRHGLFISGLTLLLIVLVTGILYGRHRVHVAGTV